MRFHVLFSALLAAPVIVFAQVCQVPAFAEMTAVAAHSEKFVEVRPANFLRMRVPSGMTHLVSGHDSFAVHYKDGRKLVLLLDDGYTLRGMSDTKPGPFLANALQGRTEEGCTFLTDWSQVQGAAYRSKFEKGPLTVFAYSGEGDRYEFVAVHADKPDLAVRGLVAGMARPVFEQLLSTITPN